MAPGDLSRHNHLHHSGVDKTQQRGNDGRLLRAEELDVGDVDSRSLQIGRREAEILAMLRATLGGLRMSWLDCSVAVCHVPS